ncbi:IS21 family transposase [Pseudarthrobacter phenanthrenivorans]|uniref:IS21 family transposase n=1 Tax=Pseudarthrobacter phenanthrenivorans TaxID=361575 RepID=UPI0011276876|nr:IS21 family transposase [Pseudarthrobacter phenanthrenivorans]TPV47581.1 IS21 family transposase [Pseudarthrobacter phenanthrenivorans]
MVRKIRAKLVLQLRAEGLSGRAIAASQGMSRKSITAVLEAADAAGMAWDDIADSLEGEVYARLFPGRGEHQSVFAQPDWDQVHREMARVGVTLKLLHGEYADSRAAAGEPVMGYDRFCRTYQRHVLVTGVASRVGHKAAQTVEVDWSGPTMQLTDPVTGKPRTVYLFVACLPFSRYAFVEPALDMKQDTWLRAHVAMFEAFGGSVPRIVPDNLKTGVIKHPREGEVVLNDAYREMAAHYSAAVLPGRIRAPKDKASVENTVAHVATWVIAGLRQQQFTALPELRAAITDRVAAYNAEPFQKRPGSRASVFAAEEQPLLTGLPAAAYEISRWVYGRRVGRNGHVVWERNYYSVPFAHIGTTVDLRITDRVLQAYRGHERLTSHLLLPESAANEYRTNDADLPAGEQYRQWDPERVREWAGRIGPAAVTVVNRIFESVPVDEQGLDAALAVLRLSRRYSAERVEAACRLALAGRVRSPRYAHLQPILATEQDKATGLRPPRDEGVEHGGYVRGAEYYAGGAK